MPTTINGIGTHYYGKKNLAARKAACRFCHRVAVLQSYDTRLWFVIVFIPVIPLGRKRIIDACPSCTRHMVADADAYEQARQLQTSGGLERYRREPSPGSALEAHGQLLSFHEHEQAAEFRAAVLERFPADAGLRVGLASQLEQASSYSEAAGLFDDALALEPDMPEARAGVAMRKMALGELDEARELIDHLEVPGAGQQYPSARSTSWRLRTRSGAGARRRWSSPGTCSGSSPRSAGSTGSARSSAGPRRPCAATSRSCRRRSTPWAGCSVPRARRIRRGSAGSSWGASPCCSWLRAS